MDALVAKSKELGFEGDVSALYDDDDAKAMSNLISAYSEQLKDRQADFVANSGDDDEGDAGDNLDEVVAKDKNEAIAVAKMQFDLKGAAAVDKARELFPNLWSN